MATAVQPEEVQYRLFCRDCQKSDLEVRVQMCVLCKLSGFCEEHAGKGHYCLQPPSNAGANLGEYEQLLRNLPATEPIKDGALSYNVKTNVTKAVPKNEYEGGTKKLQRRVSTISRHYVREGEICCVVMNGKKGVENRLTVILRAFPPPIQKQDSALDLTNIAPSQASVGADRDPTAGAELTDKPAVVKRSDSGLALSEKSKDLISLTATPALQDPASLQRLLANPTSHIPDLLFLRQSGLPIVVVQIPEELKLRLLSDVAMTVQAENTFDDGIPLALKREKKPLQPSKTPLSIEGSSAQSNGIVERVASELAATVRNAAIQNVLTMVNTASQPNSDDLVALEATAMTGSIPQGELTIASAKLASKDIGAIDEEAATATTPQDKPTTADATPPATDVTNAEEANAGSEDEDFQMVGTTTNAGYSEAEE
ncbi:MAG: hypothetical protein K0U13_02345, partial [Chlamydiae bacterium]|nr:hypothetical protein [Chlamydiota bacterium]